MRRTTALAAAVALMLAPPSIALALSRVLHGPAGPGRSAIVDVQFNIGHGHATKITRFQFANIPASCHGYPPTAVSAELSVHPSVSASGHFQAMEKTNGGRVTYTVSGQFTGLDKAAGTLRVKGTVSGCLAADTGVVHWSAAA